MKARTETNSTAIFNNNSFSNFTPTSTALKSAINGVEGRINGDNGINRNVNNFSKRNHIIPPRKISPTRYKYKIIPEELPIKKELKPLDFHTNELLEETPQIFKSISHVNGVVNGSNTFIYLTPSENDDTCQTFVISSENDDFINRKNTINQMKAGNGIEESVHDGNTEYLSYVIEKGNADEKMSGEDSAKPNVISDTDLNNQKPSEGDDEVKLEPEKKSESVTIANSELDGTVKPFDFDKFSSANIVDTNCCKKHSLEYICDKNVQCNGEKSVEDVSVVSFDKSITGRKEQAFARLQEELRKAHQELKLKDEEVSRLTRIREDVERELEELTASLFQVML